MRVGKLKESGGRMINKSLWNKTNEAIDREFGEGAKLE